MTVNQVYPIGTGWKSILSQVGVNHIDILRQAQLPEGLLNRDNVRLSSDALLRFSEAIDASVTAPDFWVRLTDAISPELFTPTIFAVLCSPDLATAAVRLARFKPLVAPFSLDMRETPEGLFLTYCWTDSSGKPPAFMYAVEALFIVKLARLGVRQHIMPTAVFVPKFPANPQAFEAFLGVRMQRGKHLQVVFSTNDAQRPFLIANSAMWNIFEPELRKRLADLEGGNNIRKTCSRRVVRGVAQRPVYSGCGCPPARREFAHAATKAAV